MEMKTKIIKVDMNNLAASLQEAAFALRQGKILAFPTETVYGLGAAWDDEEAINKIFKTKGRPQDNPLIIHVSSVDEMRKYFAFWDKLADVLTSNFCPGPFTLIMPKSTMVTGPVTAGLSTVGVRIPANPIARKLIELLGNGIAAPSANISGRPSPTNANDCYEDLNGLVEYIIDGGDALVGLESTIVAWDGSDLKLLRPGGISVEEINSCLADNNLDITLQDKTALTLAGNEAPLAPGMKYRHYAPKAKVEIISGDSIDDKLNTILDFLSEINTSNINFSDNSSGKIALYVSKELHQLLRPTGIFNTLDLSIIEFLNNDFAVSAAHGLFSAFREFDRQAVDYILVEALEEDNLAKAYMNRLRKAANN